MTAINILIGVAATFCSGGLGVAVVNAIIGRSGRRASEAHSVAAYRTREGTEESSAISPCTRVMADNDSWTRAAPIPLATEGSTLVGSAEGAIDVVWLIYSRRLKRRLVDEELQLVPEPAST